MRQHNTNRDNMMRKGFFAIALLTLLASGTAHAQIFLDDESLSQRGWLGEMDELGNIVPFHEVDWDQANYTTLGGGSLLLGILGGAFLINKKRKNHE